ncbi:MAG TPA: hypothetical protein VGP36_12560 [Mycobacteriales bacterium]|nr:hypothetical protein [Mycobacteriales bacterium]
MDELIGSLGESELAVMRATEPAALTELAEDDLIDLHTRVRRARNKYAGQYRRQAGARVGEAGARGAARPRNRRAADRAEVFEAALARVSTALAKAARRSAAELKAQRLSAARASGTGPGPDAGPEPGSTETAARPRPPVRSAGRQKRDASSLAAGARRQARRDSR